MLNLVTVLISVALTGAMAAAGVFYGGSAFTSSGAKAQAMSIIQSMAQIDSAWTLYVSSGNTDDATLPTTATLVSGGFLTSVPTAPTIAATYGGVAGTNVYRTDVISAAQDTAERGVALVLDVNSAGVCTEIARAGGQITSTGTLTAPGGASPANLTGILTPADAVTGFTQAFANYKFGCVRLGNSPTTLDLAGIPLVAADSNGAAGGSKFVVFYKR